MKTPAHHAYIALTIGLTVYSQLVVRWQVRQYGELPSDLPGMLSFFSKVLLNPWVMSSIVATLLSGLTWIAAISKFEISYAFPFVSLNYVLIVLLGVLLFHEGVTTHKVIGTSLILLGIMVLTRG